MKYYNTYDSIMLLWPAASTLLCDTIDIVYSSDYDDGSI